MTRGPYKVLALRSSSTYTNATDAPGLAHPDCDGDFAGGATALACRHWLTILPLGLTIPPGHKE
ncbi:hypothetical protein F4W66_24720 (plasmid) [Escherichia coli]|nr:hypothetical protein F4W66_24720 [Escherichia coli]